MVIKYPTSIAYTLIPNILYIIFRHLFRIFFNLNFFFVLTQVTQLLLSATGGW